MPIKTRICFQLVCDVCGVVLTDDGAPVHADSLTAVHAIADEEHWLVTADLATAVCPRRDARHQAAYDAHLPPAPPRPTPGPDEIRAAIAGLRADPNPRIRAYGDRIAARYDARDTEHHEQQGDNP